MGSTPVHDWRPSWVWCMLWEGQFPALQDIYSLDNFWIVHRDWNTLLCCLNSSLNVDTNSFNGQLHVLLRFCTFSVLTACLIHAGRFVSDCFVFFICRVHMGRKAPRYVIQICSLHFDSSFVAYFDNVRTEVKMSKAYRAVSYTHLTLPTNREV